TLDLAALGPVHGAFPGYVFVSSAHADAKATEAYLMTAAEGKIASLTSQTPGVRVVRPPEIVATRTSMAVVFELDLRGEVRQTFAIIASESRQRVWTILCIIDPAFAERYRPVFEAVVHSFEVIPPELLDRPAVMQAVVSIGAVGVALAVVGLAFYVFRKVRRSWARKSEAAMPAPAAASGAPVGPTVPATSPHAA